MIHSRSIIFIRSLRNRPSRRSVPPAARSPAALLASLVVSLAGSLAGPQSPLVGGCFGPVFAPRCARSAYATSFSGASPLSRSRSFGVATLNPETLATPESLVTRLRSLAAGFDRGLTEAPLSPMLRIVRFASAWQGRGSALRAQRRLRFSGVGLTVPLL